MSTVTRKVAELRREFAAEREADYLDLVWHPGEAQADSVRGRRQVPGRGGGACVIPCRVFPYSNVGPSRLVPGENAECACQALRDIFEWLGGVPARIVFDNAAGVGRRTFERVRLTRLFQAFQARYGFEYAFRDPYSGHEKGGVEARVGAVRRRPFRAGAQRVERSGVRRQAARTVPGSGRQGALPRGRARGRPVRAGTARRCWPCRTRGSTWSRGSGRRPTSTGVAAVEGRHRYAAGPEHAGRDGRRRAARVRGPGCPTRTAGASRRIRAPTATGPPAATTRPCRSGCRAAGPAPDGDSQVREALPDPLREWLDRQERAVLAEGLRTLRQAERESGWADTVAAMAETLEATGGLDHAGVCLAAARHASGIGPVIYDEPVDPTRVRPSLRQEGGGTSQRSEEPMDVG